LEQSFTSSQDFVTSSPTKTTIARNLSLDSGAISTALLAPAAPFTEEEGERMIEAIATIRSYASFTK